MGDPKGRSRKRSPGKQGGKSKSPLKNFTLYLDESFDDADVKDALSKVNIKFKTFSDHFKKGEGDAKILELCGRRGWAILTCDRHNRYRELEKRAVLRYGVRQFVFGANLGGPALAKLLVNTYQEMKEFARNNERPFVANVTAVGNVYLRMDKNGNVHGRQDAAKQARNG